MSPILIPLHSEEQEGQAERPEPPREPIPELSDKEQALADEYVKAADEYQFGETSEPVISQVSRESVSSTIEAYREEGLSRAEKEEKQAEEQWQTFQEQTSGPTIMTEPPSAEAQALMVNSSNPRLTKSKVYDVMKYTAAASEIYGMSLDPKYVEQNFATIAPEVDARQVDWNVVAARHPALRDMLLEQPEVAPAVIPEIEEMSNFEWWAGGAIPSILDSIKEGKPKLKLPAWGYALADSVANEIFTKPAKFSYFWNPTEEKEEKVRAAVESFENRDYGAKNAFTKGIIETAQLLPFMAADFLARQVGGAVGRVVVAAAGAAIGAAGGTAAAPGPGTAAGGAGGGAGGAAVAATVGQFAGSFAYNYYDGAGETYWRLSQMRDADGVQLAPEVVESAAKGAGIVRGLIFALGLGYIGKPAKWAITTNAAKAIPGVSSLAKYVTARAVDKMFLKAAMKHPYKTFAKQYGKHVATGVSTMAAAGMVDGATAALAMKRDLGEWGDVDVVREMSTQALTSGAEAFRAMMLISAWGPARTHFKVRGMMQAAADNAVYTQATLDQVANMQMPKNYPEGMRILGDKIRENPNAVTELLADPVEWSQSAQEAGADRYALADRLVDGGAKKLREAETTGRDFVIPIDVFSSKLAAEPVGQRIAEVLRVPGQELSARGLRVEAQKQVAAYKEKFKARQKEVDQAKEEVRKAVNEAMVKAGYKRDEAAASSRLIADFSGSMAVMADLQVPDVARTIGLHRLEWQGPEGRQAVKFAQEWLAEQAKEVKPPEEGTVGTPEPQGRVEGARVVLESQPDTSKPGSERGRFRMAVGARGEVVEMRIELLTGADKSTAAHEVAHFLSWALDAMAEAKPENKELTELRRVMHEEMGYASREERVAARTARSKLEEKAKLSNQEKANLKKLQAKEEYFSSAFESYLATGVAPSKSLAGVFARFEKWMAKIYAGPDGIAELYRRKYGRELVLNPELRSAFDRMLATEDAIYDARFGNEGAAMLYRAFRSSLNDDEKKQLDEIFRKAEEQARDEVSRTAVEATSEFEKDRERVSVEVEKELDKDPIHRMHRWLETGTLPEAEASAPGAKEFLSLLGSRGLNRKAAVAEWGVDVVRSIPREYFSDSNKGGQAPETIASAFGFKTLTELKEALLGVSRREAIQKESDARLADRYGNVLKDIHEKARDVEYTQGVPDSPILQLRLELIRKAAADAGLPKEKLITMAEAKQEAGILVREAKVSELKHLANKLTAADRRAIANSVEKRKAGDKEGAAIEQVSSFRNFIAAKAARDAVVEIEKLRAGLADRLSAADRALYARTDGAREYSSVYSQVLGALGLVKMPAEPESFSLEDVVQRLHDDGTQVYAKDLAVLSNLLRDKTKWKDLSVEDARNVANMAEVLLKGAKDAVHHTLKGEQVERGRVVKLAEETAAKNAKPLGKMQFGTMKKSFVDSIKESVFGIQGMLKNAETLAYYLDGGDVHGFWHQMLVHSRIKCRDKELNLVSRFVKTLENEWSNLPKGMRERQNEAVDLTPLGGRPEVLAEVKGIEKTPRKALWVMALHWGNYGNRQRLADGFGWDMAQVDALLKKTLTKEEWDFVANVGRLMESFYPEYKAMHEAQSGESLGKVEKAPVETPYGTYEGWYFPAIRERGFAFADRKTKSIEKLKDIIGYRLERPDASASKARASKNDQPLSLSWDLLPYHVSQVAHDIAYRVWAIDTAKFLKDPQIHALLNRYVGKDVYAQTVDWLTSVVNERADAVPPGATAVYRAFEFIRANQATNFLGFNLPNVTADMLNPLIAVAGGRIDARYLALAQKHLFESSPLEEASELAARRNESTRQLRIMSRKIAGEKLRNSVAQIRLVAMYHMEMADRLTSKLIWWGAYEQGLNENARLGFSIEEAKERAKTEANAAVRAVMPAFEAADLPQILRHRHGLRLITVFYGFFSKMYQLQSRMVTDWKSSIREEETVGGKAMETAKFTGHMLALYTLLGPFSEWLMFKGKLDNEEMSDWVIRKLVMAPLTTIPWVSYPVESAWLKAEGKMKGLSSAGSARAVGPDAFFRLLDQLPKVMTDYKKGEYADALDKTLDGLAFFMPAPMYIPKRAAMGIYKAAKGDIDVRGPFDVAAITLGGERAVSGKVRRANPFTDLQDYLEGR